jgi:hypothetical protein
LQSCDQRKCQKSEDDYIYDDDLCCYFFPDKFEIIDVNFINIEVENTNIIVDEENSRTSTNIFFLKFT